MITALKRMCQRIFGHRFLIGAMVVAVCTLLQLSGSSINEWNEFIGDGENYDTVLAGESRSIRSDEWAVFTPMAFSQTASGFQYYSEVLRGTATDAFIEYGQPVKDWAVVFRPFQIGYLVGGASYGLAFFWCGRLIALLLVSIEFAYRVLTVGKGKRGSSFLSVIYGLLLTFSSFVQWWFSVNGLVEMLIFGQLALLLLDRYFQTEKKPLRTALALLISYCAVCYLFTMYPAWEIPIAYIILIFGVCILCRHWRSSRLSRADGANVLLGVGFFAANSGYILYKSWDAIVAIMQTVYPGARSETGGNTLLAFFHYAANLFTTTDTEVTGANVCEVASVFGLFPFNLILAAAALYVCKKKGVFTKEKQLLLMLALEAFFLLYCWVGFPPFLAKITLLYVCLPGRVAPIAALLNLMILIRAVQILKEEAAERSAPKLLFWAVGILLLAALVLLLVREGWTSYITDDRGRIVIAVLILMMGMCVACIYFRRSFLLKAAFVCLAGVISFFTGMTVNPINRGTDAVYGHSVVREIQALNEANPGKWAVLNVGFPITNLPIMAGAADINCTNVYPNMELWERLDPDGTYEEIYNRYAHILICLTAEEETGFVLQSSDVIQVNLNIEDLGLLDADYILTKENLSDYRYNLEERGYLIVYAFNNYYIWEKVE